MAVVFHHLVFSYNWSHGRGWTSEGYPVSSDLGRFAVSLFFMLSGYFLVRKNITDLDNICRFYVNRFFRIAPMAWVSSFLCLSTAVIYGNNIDYTNIIYNLLMWFDFGLTINKPDINSFSGALLINGGVMWTLPWEWMFYFSLPILWFFREKTSSIMASQVLLFVSVYLISRVDYQEACFLACFCFGMISRDLGNIVEIPEKFKSIVFVFCISLVFLVGRDPLSIYSLVFEFIAFFCVCNGADVFGILRCRGVMRLGEVSYSVFLLHGIFLFYISKMLSKNHFSVNVNMAFYFGGLVLVCLVSSLTFHFIEKKGIDLGKSCCRKFIKTPARTV